jgi:hypothetical protein
MGSKRIRPYPNYANPQDGYRDSDPPEDPGQGPGGCCQNVMAQFVAPPAPIATRQTLPAGTSSLELLLVAPMAGSS